MKKLQVEFQSNADQCGLHTFKQIKRTDNTALYVRIRKDKTIHSYEAFKIKIVKAGTIFAKGAKPIEEDYESYPGKGAFGRYAHSCKDLAHAEQRYDELLKSQIVLDTVTDDEDDVDGGEKSKLDNKSAAGKRGRKAKDRSTLKIPKDKFTMKQFQLLNPDVSFAVLYQHVRGFLNIQFKIVASIGGKRGKPSIVYAPIDMLVSS
jgi:hypothetical protein